MTTAFVKIAAVIINHKRGPLSGYTKFDSECSLCSPLKKQSSKRHKCFLWRSWLATRDVINWLPKNNALSDNKKTHTIDEAFMKKKYKNKNILPN
jgi:hypothetical protein